MHSGPTRSLRLLGVPLLLTVTVGGVAPGAVTAARTAAPGPASVSIGGVLHGVAAVSARGGWAVGDTGSKTLIVRWNGSSWRRVPSPTIGAGGALRAVATVAGRAWAVGCLGCLTGTTSKTLIEHWNGKAWKRVSSPSPGTGASLNGVAAVSARSAWAVGSYRGGTLILHWDGRAWKRVHSPSPGTGASLNGVAAVSARDAWAVGHTGITGTTIRTLIERWNGKRWKRLPSPSPGAIGDDELFAVAALTARSAWAVGDISCGCGPGQSLIERWNGKVWKQVHGPPRRCIPQWRGRCIGPPCLGSRSDRNR
jgi:hypothetical protein